MKFPLVVVLAAAAAGSSPLEAQSCAQVVSRSSTVTREVADAEALRILANAQRQPTAYDLCRTLGEAIDMSRSVSTARVVFETATSLHGDFELTEVLVAAAERGLLEERTADAFFTAVQGIENDYQLRRALSAAIRVATASPLMLQRLLRESTAIVDDYQLATLLTEVARATPLTGAERERYLSAARTLRSEWEYRRAMNALTSRERALR